VISAEKPENGAIRATKRQYPPQFTVDELAISVASLHIRDILMRSLMLEPFLVQDIQIAA
jgi:hypothetical protein